MVLSSNSLFHFTSKIDYLEDILTNGFWPRYCREYGWGGNFDFALPMVCFCDIPLSQIKEHVKFYGEFGIGVSKNWVKNYKTISPVQYIASSSDEFNHITRLITLLKNQEIDNVSLCKLARAKKVAGKTDNKKGECKNKKFYDEKEWRYIPDSQKLSELVLAIKKKDVFDSNEASRITEKCKLAVNFDDILYILIPNKNYIPKIIEIIKSVIQKKVRATKERDEILLNLSSKILRVDQILHDF